MHDADSWPWAHNFVTGLINLLALVLNYRKKAQLQPVNPGHKAYINHIENLFVQQVLETWKGMSINNISW